MHPTAMVTNSRQINRVVRTRGNTLAEYALIGVSVIAVVITALMLFSSGLNKTMAAIRDDMKNHREATINAKLQQQGGLNGIEGALSADVQALLGGDMSAKLQTTGANGSTEILSDQIQKAADLMLAEGKITQDQYDILLRLANQGHKIAQVQGMIEDAVRMANGDYNAFVNMQYTLDGKTYTAGELGDLIGFEGPSPEDFATGNVLAEQASSQQEMNAFLSLYNEALSSGALNDPTLQSTVNSASTQIASLGELTEDTVYNFSIGVPIDSPAAMNAFSAESATNMNSSQICTAGNFTDSGVLCTL